MLWIGHTPTPSLAVLLLSMPLWLIMAGSMQREGSDIDNDFNLASAVAVWYAAPLHPRFYVMKAGAVIIRFLCMLSASRKMYLLLLDLVEFWPT